MKHKKLKLAAAVCLTIGFAVSCSACSTTAFTNLSSYFNKVADIMTPDKNTTPSKGEEKEKTPLATPSNFVVNEDSSFSFNGVEGASSYLVYLYDETSKELGNGLITVDDSNYYSGKLTDFVTFGYGRYTAAVVACASIVSDYTDSAAATASYSYGGAISVPRIEYCWEWDSEEGTGSMSFQLANATDYAKQAVPDSVIISITDETTAKSAPNRSIKMKSIRVLRRISSISAISWRSIPIRLRLMRFLPMRASLIRLPKLIQS